MSDFKAKMHRNRFRLGLRPRPRWGSLQRSPRLDVRGPTSKGREGEREGRQWKRKSGGVRREGREGTGPLCVSLNFPENYLCITVTLMTFDN